MEKRKLALISFGKWDKMKKNKKFTFLWPVLLIRYIYT